MVGCCNELNTGYAADGYARASSNRVAVVVVPYIVGSLSILNAITGAYSEHLRIIVIAGCPNTPFLSNRKLIHHTPSEHKKDIGLNIYREMIR
ncbi:thiamine pyrophosphate enzyme, N-terminal TPP binding domain-containing protein [Aspergillus ambiguus]|uniref:thiamine pyrophosphate enzyme, N-terminal TPP binding domain-containing protein n=1 Tax=Aspergillus ambiguus TaxID=176160 RepID=UPI003CCD0E1E